MRRRDGDGFDEQQRVEAANWWLMARDLHQRIHAMQDLIADMLASPHSDYDPRSLRESLMIYDAELGYMIRQRDRRGG